MPRCLLAAAVAAALLTCRAAASADSPAFRLDGAVDHPLVFTREALKAMPPVQVDASFGTMHGQEHHVWTGVRLLDLIAKAGLQTAAGKNPGLRHTCLVHGKDGYVVSVAEGEMDPMGENKPILIAYRSDAGPDDLPGLRLVVPGDRHGARQVHDVVEVEVK